MDLSTVTVATRLVLSLSGGIHSPQNTVQVENKGSFFTVVLGCLIKGLGLLA